AKAVYEILDSLTHKPKPNSNSRANNNNDNDNNDDDVYDDKTRNSYYIKRKKNKKSLLNSYDFTSANNIIYINTPLSISTPLSTRTFISTSTPLSAKMRHNSVDPYLNQIQQNCDGAYTTNNNTDLNSNINLSNNSIYLNSYNNVNFNNTNTNLDTNNVNISNLNLNIENNNISNFNPNSRNISYNNNYYDPWNLNTTNLRSTASPSRRRKADWDDANLKQKVQKSSPCKENFNSVLSSPSYNKQKEPIQCPGTPPNQIISINETKTPDTAFSLSEYLNMSPM
ncbi:7677_t:CDS:2, partial [Entrophospora sp. SA101]